MPVIILIVLAFFTSACTQRTQTDSNTVTVALDNPPTNLDPRIGIDATSARLFQLIFSRLVQTTDEFSVQPDLAMHWDIPDPVTYVFHLRKDARFHDGRALTARDVVFTYKSVIDGTIRTPKLGAYRPIESVEAQDDYTVVFKLKEPFASFLLNIAREGVVPEGSSVDFGRMPIGSGPFKFVRYAQDQEVVLARNDDYYGQKARIGMVAFKIIPEAIVRALELRKGSVDIAPNVLPADMVEPLRRDPELRVSQSPGTNYQYIAFNLKDPVFSDIRVRRAIAHAIDRPKIAKYLWRDQVRLASSVIPPNNWAYAPDVISYSYDPQRARQLLQEAGHPNLSFTYRTSTDDTGRVMASVLQQQFREVGIQMDIRSNEFATFFADVQKGNFQMYSLRWVGGNNDPDIFNLIFHSTMTPPNGANRGFFANSEVDRFIEIGRREVDEEQRKQAYQMIQRVAAEQLPYVSLWYNDNVAVYNKRISDIKLSPAGDYNFLTTVEVVTDDVARMP